jgi:hypothetical protein
MRPDLAIDSLRIEPQEEQVQLRRANRQIGDRRAVSKV